MPSLPDAIILCGGAGLRLRSVTGNSPKALADIAGRPFLDLLLRQLRRYGFQRVVLAVGFRGDLVRAHFGDFAFGMDIAYSPEESPLGTGGALRKAADMIESDSVLIMNGDSYTDLDLRRLVAEHHAAGTEVSLAVISPDERGDCGSVYIGQNGNVEKFREKQYPSGRAHFNAGIYMISRNLLLEMPAGIPLSLEQEVFPRWLSEGRTLKAFVCAGKCIDIGTPDRYQLAQDLLGKVEREISVPNCEDWL